MITVSARSLQRGMDIEIIVGGACSVKIVCWCLGKVWNMFSIELFNILVDNPF